MDMFVVHGGRPLQGRVRVSGAKNAALPIMAACLMSEGTAVLHDVPDLVDVHSMAQLLTTLGMQACRREDGAVELQVHDTRPCVADYDLVRRMRASICVLGPLLARRGRACVSLPGGCNIGDRPVDLHLKGLAALGADIRVERGYIFAEARRLRGRNLYLGGPFGSTVTGTANVMSAAVLAEGVTTIEAAACEPEIVDLGIFLNRLGAKITGLGTPFLHIEGVERLAGGEHTIIPDRIEAATLMLAAVITRGSVRLDNVQPEYLSAVLYKLQELGVELKWTPTSVQVQGDGALSAGDCIMLPYPGLPTDTQAQLMAVLATVPGLSIITDKVFPDRFLHAAELVRMGASIRREGASAIISGVPSLSGANVMASDLRASAALVLAALAAGGASVIRRIYHLDRGYESLEKKLAVLGAEIARVPDSAEHLPASLRMTESPGDDTGHQHALRGPRWVRDWSPLRVHREEEDQSA